MSNELKRTYVPFTQWHQKSKQIEYTQKTPLLSPDGKLLAKGWARRNVFEYNRDFVKKGIISRKEWDFYTIHVGDEMQVLISFANINIGGYVAAKLTLKQERLFVMQFNILLVPTSMFRHLLLMYPPVLKIKSVKQNLISIQKKMKEPFILRGLSRAYPWRLMFQWKLCRVLRT